MIFAWMNARVDVDIKRKRRAEEGKKKEREGKRRQIAGYFFMVSSPPPPQMDEWSVSLSLFSSRFLSFDFSLSLSFFF